MAKTKEETEHVNKDNAPQSPPEGEEKETNVNQERLAQTFERVRQRANSGDRRARESLKAYLKANPELWTRFGKLAHSAAVALIDAFSNGDWLVSEVMKRQVGQMRDELTDPDATPLEKMAIERIVVTWLRLQYTEVQSLDSKNDVGWAKYWLRRLEVADKLYRSAIQSFASIRELLPVEHRTRGSAPEDDPADTETSTQNRANQTDETPEVIGNEGASTTSLKEVAASRNGAGPGLGKNGSKKLNGHNRIAALLPTVGIEAASA